MLARAVIPGHAIPLLPEAELRPERSTDDASMQRAYRMRPHWPLLALGRTMPRAAGHCRSSIRGSARPIGAAIAGGLVAGATVNWAAGLGVAMIVAFAVASMACAVGSGRAGARARATSRTRDAARLRQQLVGRLWPEQRLELVALERLVERLRSGNQTPMESLDGLLLAFVELATELRDLVDALGATQDALPRVLCSQALPGDPAQQRARRIAVLRARARRRCLTRIDELELELDSIGQFIRLLHEQELAVGGSSTAVADLLEEAERSWEARREVEALLAAGEQDSN